MALRLMVHKKLAAAWDAWARRFVGGVRAAADGLGIMRATLAAMQQRLLFRAWGQWAAAAAQVGVPLTGELAGLPVLMPSAAAAAAAAAAAFRATVP